MVAFVLIVWSLVLLCRETVQDEITEQFVRRQYRFHFNHGLCTQTSRCLSIGTNCSQLCAAATNYLQSLNQQSYTWPDVKYDDTISTDWKTIEHLERTLAMARASQCKLCSDIDQLRQASVGCLQWWIRHKPSNPNWWWNHFGAPQRVAVVLILLRDHLSPQDIQSGSAMLSVAQARTVNTGQNGHWARYLMITQAALQQNFSALEHYTQLSWQYVTVNAHGQDGIQSDMSFFEHGMLQSGAYGADFLLNILSLVSLTQPFAALSPPTQCRQLLVDFMLDGQQYMMRSNYWDWSAKGREIARPLSPRFDPTPILDAFDRSPLWGHRLSEWNALYKRWMSCSTSSSPDVFQGTRYFPSCGYLAHHRARFFISVKMVSSRIRGAECINHENLLGFHLSDGVTFVQRTGQEYHEQAPTWDWQSLPGTTLPTAPETPAADCTLRHYGRSPYASAALISSSRGVRRAYGVAAMHFVGHNFSVPTRMAFNATSPIEAKKSWFLLDEGMVALGAGVRGVGEVRTTLNQVGLRGPVLVLRSADLDARLSPSSKNSWLTGNQTAQEAFGVHSQRLVSRFMDLLVVHDGVVYIPILSFLSLLPSDPSPRSLPPPSFELPESTRINLVQHKHVQSNWQQLNGQLPSHPVVASLFKMQLLHGSHPRQASYAYAVLPGLVSADVYQQPARNFVEKMHGIVQRMKSVVKVIRNDDKMQAVVYRSRNALLKKDCYLFAAVYAATEKVLSIPCGASKVLSIGVFSGPVVVAAQVPAGEVFGMTVTSADRRDSNVTLVVNRKLDGCSDGVTVRPDPTRHGAWSVLNVAVPIVGDKQGFMVSLSCRIV